MKKNTPIRKIAFAAVIAAVYAALTMGLGFISYGPIQFRIAEVMTVLPFFFPVAVPGLFIGCIIANLLSPYGILDVVAGSTASLLAGICTMQLGRLVRKSVPLKLLACFPPVLFNAIIIGAVIALSITGGGVAFWPAFVTFGLQVGLGQLTVLYVLGFPLILFLPKSPVYKYLSNHLEPQ